MDYIILSSSLVPSKIDVLRGMSVIMDRFYVTTMRYGRARLQLEVFCHWTIFLLYRDRSLESILFSQFLGLHVPSTSRYPDITFLMVQFAILNSKLDQSFPSTVVFYSVAGCEPPPVACIDFSFYPHYVPILKSFSERCAI